MPEEDRAMTIGNIHIQQLIRRWDSERELFCDDIVHVEASAYAYWTDFLVSTITIYRPNLCTWSIIMHLRPSNRVISLFCPNNRWIIAQIVLISSETFKSRFWNRGRPNNCFATTLCTKIRWNNANKGHYAAQGHSRSPIVIQIDFLLVINTHLLPILHRFRDIAFDRSKIAIFGYPCCVECRRWSSSLHHIMVSDTSLKTSYNIKFITTKLNSQLRN